MGIEGKVRLATGAVPTDVLAPEAAPRQRWVPLAKGDHGLEEAENVRVGIEPAPVDPAGLVVLVVRVAVVVLRLHELVARTEHRRTIGEQQQATIILDLLLTQLHYFRRSALVSFPAAVPAVVLRRTVGVAEAVRPVPLLVVRNQIVESKSVVRGDVIDALMRAVGA